MGKNPWDDDPDLQAFAGRRSSSTRWGRVFVGLIVVGGLTFVGAYYLPLFRAHDTLAADYQREIQKARTLEQSLGDTKSELQKALSRKDELEAEKRKRESGAEGASSSLEALKSELSAKLDKAEKKGLAELHVEAGALVVSLADAVVFAPKKLDVSASGKQLLCDVAKAAATQELRVSAFDDGQPDPTFSAKYPTSWQLRSARAASAVDVLEAKCAAKPERLQSLASGRASKAGSKLPAVHLEIEIRPAPTAP
jgi:chemotaxis protein MotB